MRYGKTGQDRTGQAKATTTTKRQKKTRQDKRGEEKQRQILRQTSGHDKRTEKQLPEKGESPSWRRKDRQYQPFHSKRQPTKTKQA